MSTRVTIVNGSGQELGTTADPLNIEGTLSATISAIDTVTTITNPVAVTQSGTWDEVGINDSGNSITVDYATTGSGTATGALRVELPTNGTGVIATVGTITNAVTVNSHAVTNAGTFLIQENGTQVQVDDAAFTPATSKVLMAGFEADESSTDSVDEGDGGAARMTLDRKQIVTPQPHTTGGLTTMNASSCDGGTALTNTAQVIKASAGQLYGYYIYNPNAIAAYVQFYNTAQGSVTVGTTNPLFMLTIPATSAANLMFTHGVTFSNAGWSWAATSTAGGNSAATTALDAVAWYV